MNMMDEVNELKKRINHEEMELLMQVMRQMIEEQETEEKARYAEYGVSPSEAADIVTGADSFDRLKASFGIDMLRYYNARYLMRLPEKNRAMFVPGALIAAGIIIGKRQERARHKSA